MTERKKVLFICSHNAGRSQMGEAVLNSGYQDKYEAFSAGINPAPVINPHTLGVLKEAGIDINGKKPKKLDFYRGMTFDSVVLMCECSGDIPEIPKHRDLVKKIFYNPSEFTGSEEEIMDGFRSVLSDISKWVDEYFGGIEEK
ncbi:arsenate reductase [Methanomicrobium sp. W14]|jgi:arsenate reductase|uniref:arsenate reductase ArsC n=1 Tax=Methanomicrobium sp. W14 TaxID=2817839 RepID=UPI001AE38A4E|nr:arsenate reductase ArsC [Methanomicrobium sp. W14]MBP2133520.1 arsenate reductase [Methanomicrobium sp. W14]